MNRQDGWLWLCSRKGIYQQGIARLIEHYGDIMRIYDAFEKEDITKTMSPHYQQYKEGIFPRAEWGEDYIKELKCRFQRQGIGFISIEDEAYPKHLKEIASPPFGLFYKGNLDLLKYDYLAVAGTRKPSIYGKEVSGYIGRRLALENVPIVSGMALGIDSYFHRYALESRGASIGVLGQGVDICYPMKLFDLYQRLSKEGLLVSEFPPGTKPLHFHFPFRNRIIVGMAKALLVVEAGLASGTTHTVDHALNQGKEVWAIPSPFLSEQGRGTNQMILEGAEIICSWEQLLDNLENTIKIKDKRIKNIEYENIKPNILENNEVLVYSMLNKEPIYLEDIVIKCHLDRVKLRKILLDLEKKGVCQEIYPHYFVKV